MIAVEAKRLKAEKQAPVLSKSRWCFLKRRENLTEKQSFKLQELPKMNLRTVKAYLLREQFRKFLAQWRHAATRSQLEPLKNLAKMRQNHRELGLNYFRAQKQYKSGMVKGMNRKIENLSGSEP